MNKKLSLLVLLPLLVWWGGGNIIESERSNAEQRKTAKHLVSRCVLKASGEDGVMDFGESVKLARGLGYGGQISLKDKIEFSHYATKGNLKIIQTEPTTRSLDRYGVTIEDMENYLNLP